jgi:hypothetical protein
VHRNFISTCWRDSPFTIYYAASEIKVTLTPKDDWENLKSVAHGEATPESQLIAAAVMAARAMATFCVD